MPGGMPSRFSTAMRVPPPRSSQCLVARKQLFIVTIKTFACLDGQRGHTDAYAMSPADAQEIVVIALLRADYTVAEIAEAIGVSQATVYRERSSFIARWGDTSLADSAYPSEPEEKNHRRSFKL